jgi:hypothetical protein
MQTPDAQITINVTDSTFFPVWLLYRYLDIVGVLMTDFLNLMIENYDLSDLINQVMIICLLMIMVAQTKIKIRINRNSFYNY